LRRYRRKPSFEIHLIESKKRLLSNGPKALDQDIRKISKRYDVHFHTGTRVTKMSENKVWLSSRSNLGADAALWTVGAIAPPILHKSGLAENPGNWAPVNRSLQSTYDDSVFIAGDAAQFPGLKRKQAYDAMDMGKCVAQNIKALSTGGDLIEFLPSCKPTVVSFADLQTYMIMGKMAIGSTVFASIKEGIFQTTMSKLDPPIGITPLINFFDRTSEGLFNLALPTLTSLASLRRLTHFPFFCYK
jgi:NADH dehydrogenase